MATHGVLVVDDDAAMRKAICFVLMEEGYAVFEVRSGVAALELLRGASGPMVVVLDLMMPRTSGVLLLQEVGKESKLAIRLAFVVTSAARAFAIPDLGKYLHGGYLTVPPTPFDIDELIACVEEAERYLNGHASERSEG